MIWLKGKRCYHGFCRCDGKAIHITEGVILSSSTPTLLFGFSPGVK